MSEASDVWAWLVREADYRTNRTQLHVGWAGDGPKFTEAQRNLLILGPPRANKSSGSLIPLITFAPGPVVSTSVRDDIFRATAQSRCRLGNLWHLNLDRPDSLLPGTTPLRWSPITASADWSTAMRLGNAMARAVQVGRGTEGGDYFKDKASELVATLLHAAALNGKTMRWMLRAIGGHHATLEAAVDILNRRARDSSDAGAAESGELAADLLQSIIDLDPRSRGSIFSTTSTAFAAYRHPAAMAMANEAANFDPATFVAGMPDVLNPRRFSASDRQSVEAGGHPMSSGWADTIYITASAEVQNLVAPVVVGLLAEIRAATFDQAREDNRRDYYDRRPVVWALDELANVAPMHDLPATLSQCTGSGLIVVGCLQDLDQAERIWDKEAKSLLTLFGNIVVHRGVRNEHTTRAISESLGKQWVSRPHTSYSHGEHPSRTESTQDQLLPALDAGDITLLRYGPGDRSNDRRRILFLTSRGGVFINCTPYYSAHPVTQSLVASLEWVADSSLTSDRHLDLPVPELDQGGSVATLAAADYSHQYNLVERFTSAKARLEARREARRRWMAFAALQPWFGRWEQGSYDHELYCRDFVLATGDSIDRVSLYRSLRTAMPTLQPADPGEPKLLVFGDEGHELPVTWESAVECCEVEIAALDRWAHLLSGSVPELAAAAGDGVFATAVVVRCHGQVAAAMALHASDVLRRTGSWWMWDSAGWNGWLEAEPSAPVLEMAEGS